MEGINILNAEGTEESRRGIKLEDVREQIQECPFLFTNISTVHVNAVNFDYNF